ncbi:hypothetical protein Ahy_A02g009889 isoform B [Arachis hypogaea]|uniref:Uncharacterized protein n=1 Tax=Arachis hypogaea TaxID=3818 RepID=A0A445EIF0_ARAHY|nr:hypothetical protein Ahy_A02g009889 isoform B [Arachis hypogaea]
MHDLMHDLATFLAGDLYCRFSKELGEKEERNILTRHLSYTHSIPEKACSSSEIKSLRTLLYINDIPYIRDERATLPYDILSKNKYLRVLSFDRLNIFPDSIGKLIQLRYLGLSRSDVQILPESLCNLCNLQILKLEDCSKLTMLPNGMCNLVNLQCLDIRGTPLKEMPKGMSKLKQLHILSKFVVGKQEDNGIQELGGLLNLHGSLEIEKLENVVDGNEARSARIIDKKHIDELLLKWSLSSGDDMVSNTHTDEQDILWGLQPHTGLKQLTVDGYKGKIFPDWIGHSFYQNMTSVSLKCCKNCYMLPSLGQLPSLKSLRIERFDELKSIGKEFYKNEGHQHSSPIAPFSSLEELIFYNMPSWEEWHLPDSEAFPQLKSLEIRDCPMLKGDMLNQVLMRIVFSSSDVSKVSQLEIQEDGERWYKKMSLDEDSLSIRGFECVVESAFKARIIHHLTSLQEIEISGCSSVVSLGGNCLPKSLQKLKIFNCRQIELLQQQHKYDLVNLQIYESCASLTSLSLDAFPNLENLEIEWCSNLESVSMSEPPHTALQRLTISQCSKFVSLPSDMNSLLPNLHSLDIQGCPNICRWPEGGLPANLKELSVGDCEEQVRGLSWLGNLDNLTHLTISDHHSVSRIKSYPEVGWLPRLPSLTTLHIQAFDNLETLECNELLRLTSLQQLHISWCKKLENIAGEKLPASLLLLQIDACHLLRKRCKNKHQQIWSKISHIPTIHIEQRRSKIRKIDNTWLNRNHEQQLLFGVLLLFLEITMNKVGEAFLSGFITVLLERFISAETYNLVVGKKLGPELVRRLKTALLAAEALVADAEQKQFGNQFVRKWLDDLRDAVYKADDLLDRFCIKAATQKKVGTFLPSFLNFEERQMVNQIEEVVRTIEDLERCKESLGLEKIPTGSSSWRVPSTSLARGNVYGREDDQKALTLPESLCSLCNLQTLKLYYCRKLATLPSGLHNLVSLRHLDIRGTSLEEMPGKMSKLNQLHILSYFVVGKYEDNGIQELGGLVNLHGSVEIKKLENIVDVKEAMRAKIMDKKHIDELCLEWSSGDDLVSSTQKERDILDKLQPRSGLKVLRIWGYKGTIFPDWLGNCSYENMTRVSLKSCKNCCMLPSLGQLPSLKLLRIRGFGQLRSIGEEFYKNEGDHHSSRIAPFASLETLEFDNMACWEVWHVSESETFPQLRKLQITNCRMLKEEMLNQVFFRIVSSLSDVSKVRKLLIGDHIRRHTEAMFLDGDTLTIRGSESVMESAFKAMMSINHLRCLQQIHILRCRKLEFPQLQPHKYHLVELQIHDSCDSLTSLSLDVFPNLKNLQIDRCRNLESVSMSEAPHAALQRLSISGCSKLVSFAGEGLDAPKLTHLQVSFCSKLMALPRDMKSPLPSLHSLKIKGCPNICRLGEGGLPPNLKSLEVGICEQQMRDLSWMGNLHALTHLTINGYKCKNIKSYPEVGWLPHLPSLTTLEIWHFHNLETLECNELLRLTSLQQLHISFCNKLKDMEGEKLPTSLLLLQLTRIVLSFYSENFKLSSFLLFLKFDYFDLV